MTEGIRGGDAVQATVDAGGDVTKVADSDGAVHNRFPVDEGGGAVRVQIGEGAIVAKYDESGGETPEPFDKSSVMASSVEYKTTNYMEMVVALRETQS